ncbi:MAG: hypothetical protein WCS86_03130 [Candidatus Paceibacterota bacterium]
MINRYSIIAFILIFTFFGFFTNAQVRNTDIILSISPEYPTPNQNVTATLGSHTVDLDKANITWSAGNQQMNSGIGKKSFSFKMENLGTPLTLSATIDTIDGQSLSKTMTITGADVDILWEAYDAYTPPFYKGKALAPSQGMFKIVAIPNLINQSGKVNINNLSYAWMKDGKVQSDSSGWGKNSFIFQNSYLDKNNVIKVTASDITGGINASRKITILTSNPKILFYKNDPTLGIRWEESLKDGFTIDTNGETIVAEPYFFSPKNINSSNLTFDWSLNGGGIQTPDPKNVLSIKPDSGQTGSAMIKVVINNVNTLFQSMEKQIQVSF